MDFDCLVDSEFYLLSNGSATLDLDYHGDPGTLASAMGTAVHLLGVGVIGKYNTQHQLVSVQNDDLRVCAYYPSTPAGCPVFWFWQREEGKITQDIPVGLTPRWFSPDWLVGDVNRDGIVNDTDVGLVQDSSCQVWDLRSMFDQLGGGFLAAVAEEIKSWVRTYNYAADLDWDEDVDQDDYDIAVDHLGESLPLCTFSEPTPADQAVDVPLNPTLSWTVSLHPSQIPASSSSVTYDLYLDTNNPPTTCVASDLTETTCSVGLLQEQTTYYWKVVTKECSAETAGPVWQFTTAAPTVSIQVVTPASYSDFVYETWPVQLHAVATDPVGHTLTYAWSQTGGQAVLNPSGVSTADYSFTVPTLPGTSSGPLVFEVVINDGHGGSASAEITIPAYLMGDITHDGYVNVGDLQALVARWGSGPAFSGPEDITGDGFVNVGDLQALVANWGRGKGPFDRSLYGLQAMTGAGFTFGQVGEMGLMDAGGSINFKLVAEDPVTGQNVSSVTAQVGTQLVVKLYGQGTTSGLLGVGGNIVATGQPEALTSTGQQFTWTVSAQQGGWPGPNGGMTQLGWGKFNYPFDPSFARSEYALLGSYTVTVQDAGKPVTLTWQEAPLDEDGIRVGYNGWYTTGTQSGDCQIGQITPLLINTLTVTPGAVPSFVYEGWTVNLTASGWSGYGDTLTYSWTQTGGREVVNLTSDPNTGNASFTVPTVQLTTDVPLTFTVTVTDAHDNSVTSQEVTINTYIMGDITHDGYVNVGDTQALVAVWGSGPGYTGPADLNRDGWVNVGDLQTLNANWGRSLGAVGIDFVSVPSYTYEGRAASVTCSVRSIHGEQPTYSWTQTGGWTVTNPSGADTASYSFTAPTLLCTNDAPLVFQVAVTAGQDGTATRSVTIPAYMLGDINHNGVVANSGPGNNNDYAAMQAALGSHPGDPNWNAAADFDGDGDVDTDDLNLVPSWTRTLAPPVTITSATASPSFAYEGQPVNLACSASSPHGLPLVYEWCWDGGASVTLTNPLTANASFTVPTLTYTYDTPIAFYVWVDDGSSCWAYEYVAANVYLMGDVDHDSDVDSADAAAVTAAMGTHPGETGWNAAADLDGDGVITSADQQLVTTNTGRALVESQGLMGGSFGGESLSMDAAMDGVETLAGDTPAGAAAGPVDSYGLTFEQALQRVGLLEEWLEYKATQQGQ